MTKGNPSGHEEPSPASSCDGRREGGQKRLLRHATAPRSQGREAAGNDGRVVHQRSQYKYCGRSGSYLITGNINEPTGNPDGYNLSAACAKNQPARRIFSRFLGPEPCCQYSIVSALTESIRRSVCLLCKFFACEASFTLISIFVPFRVQRVPCRTRSN